MFVIANQFSKFLLYTASSLKLSSQTITRIHYHVDYHIASYTLKREYDENSANKFKDTKIP